MAAVRVVEQDDALARGLEFVGDQFQFPLRRHAVPVTRPEIGTEKLFNPTRGMVAASTLRMREVPSVPGRGQSAACAAAIQAIATRALALGTFMNIRTACGPDYRS